MTITGDTPSRWAFTMDWTRHIDDGVTTTIIPAVSPFDLEQRGITSDAEGVAALLRARTRRGSLTDTTTKPR